MIAESRQCPKCRNFDTLVPLKDEDNDGLTTEVTGKTYAVRQFRCKACGLSDVVERDTARSARGLPDPLPGNPAPGDGRVFIVQPIDPDEPDTPEVT